jgi:hypothetical protein
MGSGERVRNPVCYLTEVGNTLIGIILASVHLPCQVDLPGLSSEHSSQSSAEYSDMSLRLQSRSAETLQVHSEVGGWLGSRKQFMRGLSPCLYIVHVS